MNMQHQMEESEIVQTSVAGVGQLLREARERQGMSVNDVANRIKFAPKQIEWLEADDYIRLPEAAFVRGFVRSYARMLEMDAVTLLAKLPVTHAQPAKSQEIKFNSVDIPLPKVANARRYSIVLLAAILVIAVAAALIKRMDSNIPEASTASEISGKVVVQPLELPSGKVDPDGKPAEESSAQESQSVAAQDNTATVPVEPKPATVPATPVVVAAPVPVVTAPVPVATSRAPVVAAPAPVVKPIPVAAPAPVKVEAPKPVTPPAAVTAPQVKKEMVVKSNPQEQAAQLPSLQPLLMYQSAKPAPMADSPAHERQQAIKRTPKSPEQQSARTVAEGGKQAAVAASPDHHALRLQFDEDTWAEIKDGEGNIISSRRHPAGTLMRVGARGQLDVVIGNARAVRLFDNGKPVDLVPYTGNNNTAHIKLK